MPHHGHEDEHGSDANEQEPQKPVIRDHRKVDPETGEARHPEGEQHAESGDALSQAEDILNSVEVPAAESVAQGVDAAEAEELKNDLRRLQAEYVNYRKRVERDRAVAGEMAVIGVLNSLLPVLDDVVEPCAGIAARDDILGDNDAFSSGSTFAGTPAGCAAGIKTLELYERLKLVDNAAHLGRVANDIMSGWEQYDIVRQVRGNGPPV